MHVEHHPLVKDFLKLRDTLARAASERCRFRRLAAEYEVLDKRICRIEEGTELLADPALNALKRQRVQLKDQVARRLAPPAAQCCGGCQG